jgi:dolichyl-diphosphooligosaccharide---protein glycosyltransferase
LTRLVAAGVFPEIVEKDYFTPNGEFKVDKSGSKTLLNCLMYKLCYYRFGQIMSEYGEHLAAG